jgi:adenine-specific DNA-methyltransferase
LNGPEFYLDDRLDFLRAQEQGCARLILTSPPYNLGKAYELRMAYDAWLEQRADTVAEAVRCLHPQGSICWQVGNHITNKGEVVPLDVAFYPIFKAHGLVCRGRIVWHYEHGLHASKRFSGRHETILWFTKGADYTFNLDPVRVPQKYPGKRHFKGPKAGQLSGNPLGKNPGDVWIIPNVKHNHPEKTAHPCQFPIELAERLVLALTNPGDLVLDPYCGVGTTILAAEKHGRRGRGSDLSGDYLAIAIERLARLRAGTLSMRAMGTPVYVPRGKVARYADD